MAKFESPAIVQRKLEAEFAKNAPKKDYTIATSQRFCGTDTIENRKRSGRPSKITEEKIDELHDVTEKQQQTSVQTVSTTCSMSRKTAHPIITEYLILTPYNAQFVQKVNEEDLQDRIDICKILIPMLEDNGIPDSLFFADEAASYLHELVNKHNIRY